MKLSLVRKSALRAIERLVRDCPDVVFIGSDLGAGVMAEAMTTNPKRVLMEGIAEQHMVGMASGLALEGFVPYVHTIGTFLTRRAYEQIVVDVALHSLPVRLIASGGGMVYAPLGPTHQAIDDFALMRLIPGMTVIAPIDPLEMEETIGLLVDWTHPAYVRVGKGGEPVVSEPGLILGRLRILREGDDALLITTGAIGHEVLTAADSLQSDDIHVTVAHIPTISPLDEDLHALMDSFASIVVIEEHLPDGGLWTAIAELIIRTDLHKVIHQICLPRQYASHYGSQSEHWEASGLSAPRIRQSVLNLVGATKNG